MCNECGQDDCGYDSEEYIRPGTQTLMYLNVYEVTRHYGGPQEGGWWFNHCEPVASVPVKAISVEGCSDVCYNCSRARNGDHDHNGKKYELCEDSYHLEPTDPNKVAELRVYLEDLYGVRREGDIYSVLGGMDILIALEDHMGERTPRPHYE